MADPLYLSLWYASFEEDEMMERAAAVMSKFPFSATRPGVTFVSVQPISWSEPSVLEERFAVGVEPAQAMEAVRELIHADYAYVFEAHWDLWGAGDERKWELAPAVVKFIVHGAAFDEGAYEQNGHVQVDFGLDSPFLAEYTELNPRVETGIKQNIQKLVEFTHKLDATPGLRGRVLWSESEENLAQKLLARLQRSH